jgi:outer membrane protein TolC
MKTILVVVLLMVGSMAVGAAVVAASYQAENNERRDLLVSSYEWRSGFARQRLASATEQVQSAERAVSLGVAGQDALAEARFKVTEAQAQVRSVELQLEEIRLTGREPVNEVSSPRVRGRDFVGDRLRVDISVPQAALELAQNRVRRAENLLSLGLLSLMDVNAARAQVAELEASVQAFQTKLEIRRAFLESKADASMVELRVLESDAVQKRKMIAPKVELARQQLERAKANVQLGTAQSVSVAEATLRLQELEAEAAKADLDLLLIRRQIEQRQGQ